MPTADDPLPNRAREVHDVGDGRGGSGEFDRTEHAKAHDRHRHIERDDAKDPDHQAARERARRVLEFAAHEARGLPAVVGVQHGDQRGSHHGKQSEPGRRRVAQGFVNGRRRDEKTRPDERRDDADLEHHEKILRPAALAHAEAVDDAEKDQDADGGDDGRQTADLRPARRQFRKNESAEQRDRAAGAPKR
jgi:hypothetical protein